MLQAALFLSLSVGLLPVASGLHVHALLCGLFLESALLFALDLRGCQRLCGRLSRHLLRFSRYRWAARHTARTGGLALPGSLWIVIAHGAL